jgi:TolB-like protein/Flp pilus assembly protein TadD
MAEETRQKIRGFRFGVFELDLQARELRRRGLKVRLQQKPLQILELLLEKAGEVVTRRELREKLWPDTFVGFDRSLNTAVNSLRHALGDSPANPRFVETRSRYGYRFIAPVDTTSRAGGLHGQNGGTVDSIAVLPFQNAAGDIETEYLSDGITESLIHTLSQLPEIRVMARTTVFRYKGKEIDPQMLAHDLNVRALLTGRVMQRGDLLTIGVELVDALKGWRLWGEQYNRKFSSILEMQEEISKEISEKLRLRLTAEEKKRLSKRYTTNAEAYQDYLKGRYHWNKMTEEGLNQGIAYFERAIRQDPTFALPYAGLSDSYALFAFFGIRPSREVMPKAEMSARKALEMDSTLAEAHASLAGILKSFHWNWEEATMEYKLALELNPNNATAHRWYADFLAALGRSQEAAREMERARELDPLSLVINMELAWNWYMARENVRAVEQARKTLEVEPQFSPAYHVLGLACEQMGKFTEAIAALQRAQQGSVGNPINLASLGYTYGRARHKSEAKKVLSELRTLAKQSYVSPYAYSIVYLGLGDKEQGLKWLVKAYDEHDVWLIWILRDPRLDLIRQESAFKDLLRQMNLPVVSPPFVNNRKT